MTPDEAIGLTARAINGGLDPADFVARLSATGLAALRSSLHCEGYHAIARYAPPQPTPMPTSPGDPIKTAVRALGAAASISMIDKIMKGKLLNPSRAQDAEDTHP